MSLVGNIIWLVFGGFFTGLGYILGGFASMLTIIGIPFGFQMMKLGISAFLPFGKRAVTHPRAGSTGYIIVNVIWFILPGWAIALHHLIWAILLGITIIGIPFAKQHLKLLPLACAPFGRELV